MLLSVSPKAIVLDIEGTIGSIKFVADVLFPYSLARLEGFVAANATSPDVIAILAATAREVPGTDPLETLLDWHQRDVKAGPLKQLQGLIWDQGFRQGAFQAHLYDDAVAAMQRWHAQGLPLIIYSSGSVKAQLLYFEFSAHGDLRGLIHRHYDTSVGPKLEASSYHNIASDLGFAPADVLFFSDNPREVIAARDAGWQAVQIVRDGTIADPDLPQAADFTHIMIL